MLNLDTATVEQFRSIKIGDLMNIDPSCVESWLIDNSEQRRAANQRKMKQKYETVGYFQSGDGLYIDIMLGIFLTGELELCAQFSFNTQDGDTDLNIGVNAGDGFDYLAIPLRINMNDSITDQFAENESWLTLSTIYPDQAQHLQTAVTTAFKQASDEE